MGGDLVPLSAATHAAIGAFSGLVEVSLLHPTVTVKNALQEKRALPRTLSQLYRGYLLNACSFIPITCLQFGVHRSLETALAGSGEAAGLSSAQRVAVAASAGIASSFISTPCELVIIQQQRTCAPLVATTQGLMRQHGAAVLMRGLGPCLLRESCYTAGYLGTAPLVTAMLLRRDAFKDSPSKALVMGAMLSGAAAAVITQPLDTVKTRMQANLEDPRQLYSSMGRGLRTLWAEGGVGALWAGLVPRGGRIMAACVILTECREFALEQLEHRTAS